MKLAAFLLAWSLPLLAFVTYVWWEHSQRSKNSLPPRASEQRLFYQYREFLNDRVGFFSFTFGLAALGTDSPQFYALLSLGFVLTIWFIRAREFARVVRLWREEKSRYMSIWTIVKEFPVFVLGYVFLLAVLFGWLQKSTLKAETANAVAKLVGVF